MSPLSAALRHCERLTIAPATPVLALVERRLNELYEFVSKEASGTVDRLPPEMFAYLWQWFCQVRYMHRDARDPLRASELESWARLRGLSVEPFEASALLHMDVVFRSSLPEPSKR